ncbi:hypothetical protein AAU57_08600 [Nonlabens sp. YIK11]|uniref:hypothetical protein n=1 Tax=Nonlabens sp. YIK11 TaxID=1453349 RepID=UPI0006DC20B5|nr:hypothetical protein [Nonlabens sp. YIK11]KQC33365.1 hypothetical protein AAU57_08600 [Nonlabens sp. YIK11]
MALEIKNIEGVICIKGEVTTNRLTELKNYFTAALKFENRLVVNVCQVGHGQASLLFLLQQIKDSLSIDRSLIFFGSPDRNVKQLLKEINSPANYYQAA